MNRFTSDLLVSLQGSILPVAAHKTNIAHRELNFDRGSGRIEYDY